MNCKEGDLAIIVKSWSGNEGKIVTCVKFLGSIPEATGEDVWEVDIQLNSTWNINWMPCGPINWTYDSCLIPLRGDLLNDEITNTKELETL